MANCIILNYHSILDSSNQREADPIYSVSKSDFVNHLEIIKDSGLNIITIPEIFTSRTENSIALSFDDGFTSDYNIVFPLIKEFGFKGSFFITMKNVDSNSRRWNEYKELTREGNYVGAHGITHKYLTNLEIDQQRFELDESRKIIYRKTGSESNVFSLPGGKYNAETIRIAKSLGFKGLLTTEFGLCNLEKIPFLINRCTVRTNFSKGKLQELLNFNKFLIQKEIGLSKLKKTGQLILGNKLSDRLNYLLRG